MKSGKESSGHDEEAPALIKKASYVTQTSKMYWTSLHSLGFRNHNIQIDKNMYTLFLESSEEALSRVHPKASVANGIGRPSETYVSGSASFVLAPKH